MPRRKGWDWRRSGLNDQVTLGQWQAGQDRISINEANGNECDRKSYSLFIRLNIRYSLI